MSLDDVMKKAYANYSGQSGFRPGEFEAVASMVAGTNLREWFDQVVRSTKELDYSDALEWYGLKFSCDTQGRGVAPTSGWLGLSTRVDDGRLIVARVRRETPSYEAGINVEDEILAIDDHRIRPRDWRRQLALYKSGQEVTILVSRRSCLKRLPLQFGKRPSGQWRLMLVDSPSPEQAGRLKRWLASRSLGRNLTSIDPDQKDNNS